MATALFILDVPENSPIAALAGATPGARIDRTGPYFRITSDSVIEVDRRATQCRHAVWYSGIAGVLGGRIIQWDKDALKVAGQ
ncbi:hypothetical protein [Mycolicibacterium sp. HS_4_1]